jgi:hypothetical protein
LKFSDGRADGAKDDGLIQMIHIKVSAAV